jgi:hypothetical protein
MGALEKGLPLCPWKELYGELANVARAEGALLVGYGDTELRFLQQAVPLHAEDLEGRYLNANAGRWFRNHMPEVYEELYLKVRKEDPMGKPGLKDFVGHPVVDFTYPRHLQGFSPAAAITRLRLQFGKKLTYADTAPGGKRAWTKLIQYNQQDVLSMKHLVEFTVAQR